ncbi:uncharacterized protein G2W53_041261 [Senna tora]|uniref:Uncharacterized protein n=1 Tax=Senna tora TaxID=362788 RepID=A0A834SDF7_9FABA|nr:uncharacterized protein G2W53_041261 [Senna tora]
MASTSEIIAGWSSCQTVLVDIDEAKGASL